MSTSPPSAPRREMKVLAMGLPRTGTASMAEALTVLGYQNVFHGLKAIDHIDDFKVLHRAAKASFSWLPSYTGKPFTQAQWDELLGACDATTDMTAAFGTSLIDAYPNAKVILVIRDFEKWWKSMDEGVIQSLWGPAGTFSINFIEPVLGSESGPASRKIMQGFFRAHDAEGIRKNAREAYDRHHREIRERVPKGQLLEYKMGDGWEPICEFLGKDVPDGEFPWVNEQAELQKKIEEQIRKMGMKALTRVLPVVVGVVATGFGVYNYAF